MHPHLPFNHRRRIGFTAPRVLRTVPEQLAPEGVAEWTSLTVADAEGVLALLGICEEHDDVPYRSTAEDVAELFEPAVRHEAYGAKDPLGRLVAFGIVRLLIEGDRVDARCSGSVHPEWRDRRIGTAIVEWQLEAGRSLLAGVEAPGGTRISRFCDSKSEGEIDLLERMGFTPRDAFVQMRRDLNDDIPQTELAQHLRIEPWQAEWSEMIREASEAPEAATADGRKLTENEWEQMHENLVPEWSAVVVDRSTDRSRVAGYVMAARWEDEWEALGWSEGYINALGIFSPWRKQGVGTSLLAHSMRRMREAGMEFAGIDIGLDDRDGLALLCKALGFEPTHRTTLYAVDVTPAPSESAPE